MPELQVLICAYGHDAMERIASLPHPPFPGVEYLVSWQNYDKERLPATIAQRNDFKVFYEDSIGLCNNRNALFSRADAGIALIADDDLEYTPAHFENVLRAFESNPDCHILTFRYESEKFPKDYPQKEFDLRHPEKGYFVTSMEIAFNLQKIREERDSLADLHFHTAFGVNGTLFDCGEEDVLVTSLLRKDYHGKYIPLPVCRNTESTTSERVGHTEGFIATKGAVMLYLKPATWPLRMLAHAFRARPAVAFTDYCKWWLKGVRMARKHHLF